MREPKRGDKVAVGAAPLIFVGGSQRSGTALMQGILSQDPSAMPMTGEAKYLAALVRAHVVGVRTFRDATCDFFTDRAQFDAFHMRVLDEFMALVSARYPDRSTLVFKSPALTRSFPDLAGLLPQARFICMYRDPKDVMASLLQVQQRMRRHSLPEPPVGRLARKRDIAGLCRHVDSFYRPLLAQPRSLSGSRLLWLAYASLVQESDQALQAVRDFTGLELQGLERSTAMDPGPFGRRALSPVSASWQTPLSGGPISASSVGNWRRVLTEQEAGLVDRLCGPLVAEVSPLLAFPPVALQEGGAKV